MSEDLLFESETGAIIGAAIEVINTIGHGLLEKPYEKALAVEFSLQGIPFDRQQRFAVEYKGHLVGEYIPDLIAFDQIIVEIKTVDKIGANEIGQMINYLHLAKLKVGLIINFRHARLEWKRIVA
ncbi:MAG TPA: GxxExxY protein [Candidatus Rifleibacterium sp.]|nr:GxxExxY protein [Candidatus Rifleibacterium sp.]